jgi:hypothetical protein
LLKLESSPATDPGRGCTDTIARERRDIELLLEDSPSLKGDVARVVSEEMQRAVRYATRALLRHREATPEAIAQLAAARFTEEQVLGDWFPGDSSLPANEEKEEPG